MKINEKKLKKIVMFMSENKLEVATMESCTGGSVINTLTNVEGASEIVKFSAITYATDYKIKMGVSEKIIDHYTVYSIETAKEMSKKITEYTNADFGIGITGKLQSSDKANEGGSDDIVYISIYDKINDEYHNDKIKVTAGNRTDNKKIVVNKVLELLEKIVTD